MAIAIDDVKLWTTGGIGHVIIGQQHGWYYTACQSFGTFGKTKKRPKRICRKCRAALPKLTPVKKPEGNT